MNADTFKGKWKEFKGKVQSKWGELTGDEVDQINGDYNQFVGTIQQKYGRSRAEAEEEVNEWLDSLDD